MTALLIDTHVALWLLAGVALAPEAAEAIADPANDVHLSIASPWEIAITQSTGRLVIRDDDVDVLLGQGVRLLPIGLEHVRAARALPPHHRDPFDRMLVAQAQVERLRLVTRDSRLRAYDVALLAA